MKVPQMFKLEKGLDEKTQNLVKGIVYLGKKEGPPEVIKTLDDAVQYIAHSLIPICGYDKKKRIHRTKITIKEAMQKNIALGKVDLLDTNPLVYKDLFFSRSQDTSLDKELAVKLSIDFLDHKIELPTDGVVQVKQHVKVIQNKQWVLENIDYTADFIRTNTCTTVKVDTPPEILWVFETFKKFHPRIHGGALRDLYLGIERTADVDIQLSVDGNVDGKKGDHKVYKALKRVMDKVNVVERGHLDSSYKHMGEYKPTHYHAKKDGVLYDIAGGSFERYLSTEQTTMERPGELIIHDLAKYDMDNKQFRIIKFEVEVSERILSKIKKLENMGLTFLPENPLNLLNKVDLSKNPGKSRAGGVYS